MEEAMVETMENENTKEENPQKWQNWLVFLSTEIWWR